jgi:hypothetical protein
MDRRWTDASPALVAGSIGIVRNAMIDFNSLAFLHVTLQGEWPACGVAQTLQTVPDTREGQAAGGRRRRYRGLARPAVRHGVLGRFAPRVARD